jgi:hypothetical protein
MQEMQQIKRNLERAIQNEQPIEWTRHEAWNARLERLPRTCLLWQHYQRFDAARAEFEALDAKRNSWGGELSKINRRMETGLDELSDAEWSKTYLRGKRLEWTLRATDQRHKEFKLRFEREQEVWGQTWAGYVRLLGEVDRVRKATPTRIAAVFDARPDLLGPLEQQQRQWEAARD